MMTTILVLFVDVIMENLSVHLGNAQSIINFLGKMLITLLVCLKNLGRQIQ